MFPPKANDAVCESPDPAKDCLAVFKLPPVDQAPTGMPVFHSSVAVVVGGILPPAIIPAVVLPAPA